MRVKSIARASCTPPVTRSLHSGPTRTAKIPQAFNAARETKSRPNTLRNHLQTVFIAECACVLALAARHAPADDAAAAKNFAARDSKLDPMFLAVAKNYEQWGRVDDDLRWAPDLCRGPMPATPHFSNSDDASTHGKKLYSLFAADRGAYFAAQRPAPTKSGPPKPAPTESAPLGTRLAIPELRDVRQVLVKESWTVKEATEEEAARPEKREIKISPPTFSGDLPVDLTIDQSFLWSADHFSRYVRKNGKVYHAEEQAGLFVMIQRSSNEKDTDDGWVYGTLSADGKQVTSSGLVQTCMNCHQQAPHGRLFGTPSSSFGN